MRSGSLASLVGQGESFSLMACSVCRCHLVIILRLPSANWSGRDWPLSLLALCDWQDPCCFLFYSDLPLHLLLASNRPGMVRARGKTEDTHRRIKSKLWTQPQGKLRYINDASAFLTWAPLAARCLASRPQRCRDAEVRCQNKLQSSRLSHLFHLPLALPRKWSTWFFHFFKLSVERILRC